VIKGAKSANLDDSISHLSWEYMAPPFCSPFKHDFISVAGAFNRRAYILFNTSRAFFPATPLWLTSFFSSGVSSAMRLPSGSSNMGS
jgi:hypothetical protein